MKTLREREENIKGAKGKWCHKSQKKILGRELSVLRTESEKSASRRAEKYS